jgi:hypothetical protein
VHRAYEAGPGWDASDAYYFIRDGQLYYVLILHAGGRQDRELYDRFLRGLTFPEGS